MTITFKEVNYLGLFKITYWRLICDTCEAKITNWHRKKWSDELKIDTLICKHCASNIKNIIQGGTPLGGNSYKRWLADEQLKKLGLKDNYGGYYD